MLVVQRTGQDVTMHGRPRRLVARPRARASREWCEPERMESEDMLYLLYTSGTTAKPKGILHTTGGYLTGVTSTHRNVFDIKEDDVFWAAADIGWVTGHSYIVYGAAGQSHHRRHVRGDARLAGSQPLVGDHRALRGDDPLHGADRDPRPHEMGPAVRRAA